MKLAALVLALLVAVPAAEAGVPTILDFHSQNCPPCRKMRPEIETLRQAKYPIRSIDVERQAEWAERYDVREVPTFIVIDEQGQVLARSKGYQPAKDLADLFNQARGQATENTAEAADDSNRSDGGDLLVDSETTENAANPEPWKTVVRFQIDDPHTRRVGYGSGTIIESNAEESLILTCAHLFKIDGAREQYAPSKFPLRVTVELFDGVGRGSNMTVLPIQKIPGKVVDYNFSTDVALVKIRPGRRLPYSKVVPATWKPQAGQKMTTVGCSQGRDPTAWTTSILKPAAAGPDPNYRGMECVHAPKQGRSGGGIFTPEGYVAGVCDFASFTNTGLYARPESIHRLLDRNRLTALYTPGAPRDSAIAMDNEKSVPARSPGTARLARNSTPIDTSNGRSITIPRPEMLGIRDPGSSYETVGIAWRATPVSHPRSAVQGPQVEVDPQVPPVQAVPQAPRRITQQAGRIRTPGPDVALDRDDDDEIDTLDGAGKPTPSRATRVAPPTQKSNVGMWQAASSGR